MGFLLYNRYGNTSRQIELRDTQRLLESTATSIETYLRNMRQIEDTINYSVIQELDVSDAQFNQELSLLYETNKDKIQSVVLCDDNGQLIAAEPVIVQKEGVDISEQSWFRVAVGEIENMHFSVPHIQNLFEDDSYRYHRVISLSRSVDIIDGDKLKLSIEKLN